MAGLPSRLAPVDCDICSDVRSHLEGDLARDVERLLGPNVNGLDVVDAVTYRLLSRLSAEDLVRMAEETDAIEDLVRAGVALRERYRRERENVVPFRARR